MTIAHMPPGPSIQDPDNFDVKADAWVAAVNPMIDQVNASNAQVNADAVAAAASAAAAQQSVADASAQVGLAAAQVPLAAAQVGLAAVQVGLAAAKVPLAAAQVGLAAEQVALAAVQAGRASAQANSAAEQVPLAAAQANNAATSAAKAAASEENALSSKNSAATSAASAAASSTLAGVPVLTGSGSKFLQANAAETGLQWGDTYISKTYALRADLRALDVPAAPAIVEGLGLFVWTAGSTEPDDDETCFTTATGAWTLSAASWDVAYAYWLADHSAQEEDLETLGGRTTAVEGRAAMLEAFKAQFLRGAFSMTLTSLATVASSDFTVPVPGAAVGDSVLVNPGNQFGTSATDKAALSYTAYVSAAGTVTVSIRNASAISAALTASIWAVLIIKQ